MRASWNSGVLCSRGAGLIERVSRLLVSFIERFAPSAIAAGTCDKIADKTTSKRRGRECCYRGGDNGNGEQSTDTFFMTSSTVCRSSSDLSDKEEDFTRRRCCV